VLQADKELLLFPVISAILSILVVVTFFVPQSWPDSSRRARATCRDVGRGLRVRAPLLRGPVLRDLLLQYGAGRRGDDSPARRRPDGGRRLSHRGGPRRRHPGLRPYLAPRWVWSCVRSPSAAACWPTGRGPGRLAWSLATFLVVPVLVVEDVGPIEAIRQSAPTEADLGRARSPATSGWACSSAVSLGTLAPACC